MLREKYGGHLEDREFADYHLEIAAVVEADFKDIQKFAKTQSLDTVLYLDEHLCTFETSIAYLRNCLQTRELDVLFEESSGEAVRQEIEERLGEF